MGTRARRSSAIATALFSKVRLALLSLFYQNPGRTFYLREIIRLLGFGQGAVQRELANLTAAELLTRTSRGNQVAFAANPHTPVFPALRQLIVSSTGALVVIKEALAGLDTQILVAFLFGSFARGEERAASDVDLLVLGGASFESVVFALADAQRELGREINPVVFSPQEFRQRLQSGNHFLNAIVGEPKLFIKGDEDELAAMAR